MEMKETEVQNASTPQNESAVSQSEAIFTVETPVEEKTAENVAETVNVIDGSAPPIENEMAPAVAVDTMPTSAAPVIAEKKSSMTFAQFRAKYLNQKVFDLILRAIGLAMLVLSVLEFGHLALLFTGIYGEMMESIIGLKYGHYFQIIITLVALGAYLLQIISAIVALLKKGHKVRLDHIATPLGISVLWRFFAKFNEESYFCRTLQLGACYEVLLWVLLVYIVIRMLKSDWNKRLGAVVCGMVGIALIIGLYLLMEDGVFFSVAFKNIGSGMGWSELGSVALDLEGFEQLVLVLYILSGIFSALLPFMALSMIGYYVDVLAGDESYQYYSLSYAYKTSVVMIVMESINIAFDLTCYFLSKSKGGIVCTIDYKMMILSLLLPIALVIINGLPWKIHSKIYARNCKKHDQLRGAK